MEQTNFKFADDSPWDTEPYEIPSLTMSYIWQGNSGNDRRIIRHVVQVGGDTFEGSLGLLMQVLASRTMQKWTASINIPANGTLPR